MRTTPARALLLADGDELTYRVMRCVCDAGMQVHVLGTAGGPAERLARSRYCRSFHTTVAGAWASGAALPQVNALARSLDAQLVFATDPATTRFVVWQGSGITARTFPVLESATFERLVNKDSFVAVCEEIGLPHPRTSVCRDANDLLAMLDAACGLPLVIKPTDGYSGHGVWTLAQGDEASRQRIRSLEYRPIVAQEFISGYDVNALLLCKAGRIEASIAYRLQPREFSVVDDEQINKHLAHAAEALKLEGAIGFDMRMDTAGRVWFIECNPRFTYEGSLVGYLSGYNIIKQFLRPGSLPARAPAARMNRAKLLRPWSLLAPDRRHARYLLTDPRHSVAQACREFYLTKLHGSAPGFGA